MRFVLFVGLLTIAEAIRPEVTEGQGPMFLIIVLISYALWLDLDEYLAGRVKE